MSRMTAPVGEVTTPITRGQIGQQLLARRVEQALGGEFDAPRLQQRHQRADAGRLHRLDDDLIGRFAGKSGDLAGGDHFHSLFGAHAQAREHAFPDHRVDARALVFQRKIGVAGRMRPAIVRDFAAHAHIAESILDRALQRARKLGDGKLRRIGGGLGIRPCRLYARSARRRPERGLPTPALWLCLINSLKSRADLGGESGPFAPSPSSRPNVAPTVCRRAACELKWRGGQALDLECRG